MAVTIPITKTKITTQWGTSVSNDITDLRDILTELQATGGGITIETAIDAVAAALKPGNNIDITYDDELGTLTINVEPLTKADVSLGNVDNTSDANKPVSTAQQTALDTKAGADATTSALSAKQPLDPDLTVIAGLTPSANDSLQFIGTAWANRTPAEVKTTLALNNVSNTADTAKPVSTAQQAAIAATAQGLLVRYTKPSNQGGFDGTEHAISGFDSVVMNTLANRYTTVSYGLVITSVTTNPVAQTYIVVNLRNGSATGPILESHIYPWVPSQQNFGAGYIALQGSFATQSWAANGTATLTLAAYGGLNMSLGVGSYLETFDQGNTS